MKDIMPMDIEISQAEEYDKKSVEAMERLLASEEAVARSFKELADRLDRATKDKEKYINTQKEMERQYIQLIQRKSQLVTAMDMQVLKEHLKKTEETITSQQQVVVIMKEMSDAYQEYINAMKDLTKSWQTQLKSEMEWRKTSYEFVKARENQDGGKMEKLEREITKQKQNAVKTFQDKAHRITFVEKAMVRINQTWQKLKMGIKNFGW